MDRKKSDKPMDRLALVSAGGLAPTKRRFKNYKEVIFNKSLIGVLKMKYN